MRQDRPPLEVSDPLPLRRPLVDPLRVLLHEALGAGLRLPDVLLLLQLAEDLLADLLLELLERSLQGLGRILEEIALPPLQVRPPLLDGPLHLDRRVVPQGRVPVGVPHDPAIPRRINLWRIPPRLLLLDLLLLDGLLLPGPQELVELPLEPGIPASEGRLLSQPAIQPVGFDHPPDGLVVGLVLASKVDAVLGPDSFEEAGLRSDWRRRRSRLLLASVIHANRIRDSTTIARDDTRITPSLGSCGRGGPRVVDRPAVALVVESPPPRDQHKALTETVISQWEPL